MNAQPFCTACQQPVVRICAHPSCDYIPFLCGNKCKKDQDFAMKTHTHNKKTTLIPWKQFSIKVAQMEQSLITQNDTDFILKRLRVFASDLECLIKRYCAEMKDKKKQLKQSIQNTLNNLKDSDKFTEIQGKHFYQILNDKDSGIDYQNPIQKGIDILKGQMGDIINGLQQINLNEILNKEQSIQLFQKAAERFKNNNLVEGRNFEEKAHQLFPFHQKSFSHLKQQEGKCSKQQKKRKTKTIEEVQQKKPTNEQNVNKAQKMYKQGLKCEKKQQTKEAIRYFSKAIQLNRQVSHYFFSRANVYLSQKKVKYDNAISDLNEAIQLQPNNHVYYNCRAFCFGKLSHFRQATEDYQKSVSIFDRDAEIFNSLGLVYSESDQFEKAIINFDKAIDRSHDQTFLNNMNKLKYTWEVVQRNSDSC